MAHKNCIKKLDKKCDCIPDDLMTLEVIENNIKNLERIIEHYFIEYQKEIPQYIGNLSNYIRLRLKVINE